MREDELDALLSGLPSECRNIVLALREVVAQIIPEAEERVLWGGLCYHRPWIGGPVKGAVCQVVAKRGEVRLDFIHGVRLSDPRELLRGDRVSKRYVRIRSVAEARRPEIADLIREASDLDPSTRISTGKK
jgi:hypothetical protein